MNEILKKILTCIVIGIGIACAAGAAYVALQWLYHKLKSFVAHWWEDNKQRFRNGEDIQIFVGLRDLMNQLKQNRDRILLQLRLKRPRNVEYGRKPISLPPLDDEEIPTNIECSRKQAEKLLEDQNRKETPICTMCC